jgi:SNF family Na+-dependent transporter
VLEKSNSMEDLGGINWKLFVSLLIAWLITALALLRGVEIIGKISWFTDKRLYNCLTYVVLIGSVPYIIVVILFCRGITLDGAEIGMRFYLTEPDFSHIFRLEVC